MKCPKCSAEMYISEWDGWIFICFNCYFEGRNATDQEIEKYEEEMAEYANNNTG